jgi:hypothetical protein
VSEFDFSLVRLIFAAEEQVFTLVLIAPLQSPWSSVTQGPFLGRFLSRDKPQVAATPNAPAES